MFIYLCRCACEPVCFTIKCGSQFCPSTMFPLPLRDQTQVAKLGSKHFYPVGHVSGLHICNFVQFSNEWRNILFVGVFPPYSIGITICVVSTGTHTASGSLHCLVHIL